MRLRMLRFLVNQDTALANAAEASSELRSRREERDEVDAYLRGLGPTLPSRPALHRRLSGAHEILRHAVELHVAVLGDSAKYGEGLVGS